MGDRLRPSARKYFRRGNNLRSVDALPAFAHLRPGAGRSDTVAPAVLKAVRWRGNHACSVKMALKGRGARRHLGGNPYKPCLVHAVLAFTIGDYRSLGSEVIH